MSAADSDAAYLRPLVERLGAEEVHRLVDLIAADQDAREEGTGPDDEARDD
jgi:hypothetical protein